MLQSRLWWGGLGRVARERVPPAPGPGETRAVNMTAVWLALLLALAQHHLGKSICPTVISAKPKQDLYRLCTLPTTDRDKWSDDRNLSPNFLCRLTSLGTWSWTKTSFSFKEGLSLKNDHTSYRLLYLRLSLRAIRLYVIWYVACVFLEFHTMITRWQSDITI